MLDAEGKGPAGNIIIPSGDETMIDAIEQTIELNAPPERVWRAITDPDELGTWFPDEAVDLEVRAGEGGWWHWEEHGKFAVRFEVLEPPRKLVWHWCHEPGVPVDEGPTTTVEFHLEPTDDGGTMLTVREHGFLTEEHREQNRKGWEHELEELREFVETEEPVSQA